MLYFRVGRPSANVAAHQDIQLSGAHILDEHCLFETKDSVVTMIPCESAQCYVNGRQITEPTVLKTGSRVIFGKSHVFRFNHPAQGKPEPHSSFISLKSVSVSVCDSTSFTCSWVLYSGYGLYIVNKLLFW